MKPSLIVERDVKMKISDIYHYHNYVEQEIVSHPLVVSNNLVGLEIELENVNRRSINSSYWTSDEDGSLRNNGREFMFRVPIGGANLFKAIAEASKHFYEDKPEATMRCSAHMHYDVRGKTVDQLKNLLIAYTVYEKAMFKCSGMNRYKNNFCPAYGFAQNQLTVLSKYWNLEGGDFLNRVINNWAKYSALNLLPICDKGSIELRISNAITTSGSLLRLCNRFMTLDNIAMNWQGSHEELIAYLSETDVNQIFTKKLTGILEDPIVQADVKEGAIFANDIIHLRTYRSTSSGDNIPTLLDRSIIHTLLDIAITRSSEMNERTERWISMKESLETILENESWECLPLETLMEIRRLYGVTSSYLVAQEYREFLQQGVVF